MFGAEEGVKYLYQILFRDVMVIDTPFDRQYINGMFRKGDSRT